MENEREDRPRKKKKKKKSRVGYYLYAVVVLLLAIAIIVISVLLLFHVQKIDVTGTGYSQKSDIVEWVREDPYTSNALYAIVKFKSGSCKLPAYLEKAEVGLAAPWALRVKVTEKKMIGCVATEQEYIYFDQKGLVLLKGIEVIEGVPVIEGLEIGEAELYKTLSVDDEKVFSYIVKLTKEVEKTELSPERIVWEENSMNLYFKGVCVRLGRSSFDEKLVQLPPVLEKLEGKSGVLDMEYYNETSKKISFREEVTANE